MTESIRLRHLVQLRTDKSSEELPVVNLDGIGQGTGSLIETPEIAAADGHLRFHPGDVLFSKLRPYLAKSWLVDCDSHGTSELLAFTPGSDVDARFLLYVTLSSPWLEWAEVTSYGTKMPRTSWENLADYRIWTPPLEVQRRIADFLDDQVDRIDHAIQRRRRQIELTTARVAQRTSDLLWGDLSPIRVRFVITSVTSGPRGWGELVGDRGTPFIRVVNLPSSGVTLDSNNMACVELPETQEARRSTCVAGDVLVAITGATVGHCALVTPAHSGSTFSQHIARLRPRQGISSDWLAWCMQTPTTRSAIRDLSREGIKQGLGLEDIKDLQVPFADSAIQRVLSDKARDEWEVGQNMRAALTTAGNLLAERKRALVTAAVTGEFDVSSASSRAADLVAEGV